MSKLNTTEEGTVYRFIIGGQPVRLAIVGEPEPIPPDSLGVTMDKESYERVMERLSKFKEEFENGRAEKIIVFFPGIGSSYAAKIPRQFQTGELPNGFIVPILSEEEEKLINSINAVTDAVKKAEHSIAEVK
jgi:hypothetical protein